MIETLLDKKLKADIEAMDFAIKEDRMKKSGKDYLIDVPRFSNGGSAKKGGIIKSLVKRGEIR